MKMMIKKRINKISKKTKFKKISCKEKKVIKKNREAKEIKNNFKHNLKIFKMSSKAYTKKVFKIKTHFKMMMKVSLNQKLLIIKAVLNKKFKLLTWNLL